MSTDADPADYDWVEDTDDKADWIKTGRWDLPTDLRAVLEAVGSGPSIREQKNALGHLMSLPAWEAAPTMLKNQAARFLAGHDPIR